MGWASAITAGIQNFTGGLTQYYNDKASAQEALYQADAARQRAAAQAAVANQQAKVAMIQAVNAQRQGDIEANKRSRILANDIGSTYANWAGNGLLVDKGAKDTMNDIEHSARQEADFDINTMLENAGMNAWTHTQTAAAAYKSQASAAMLSGELEARAYERQSQTLKDSSAFGYMQAMTGVPSGVLQAAGVKPDLNNGIWKFGGLYGWGDPIFLR